MKINSTNVNGVGYLRWRTQTHKIKMNTKLTFALVASLTGTAFAEFKAPLPEFKNEKQLAEWRAEKASEANSQDHTAEETTFYTGKPYLASSGGYAFKYRNYNPEVARWTTEDPSGFPDGANGSVYAPIPSSELDSLGLWRIKLTSSGDGLSIYGGAPGTYTWEDRSGALTGKGQISFATAASQGDIKSSWTYIAQGTATRDGVPISVFSMYTISVRDDGKLYVENSTGTASLGSNLNVSVQGKFSGEESRNLSFDYHVGAFYKATGIDGFSIQIKSTGGMLKWTTAETHVVGDVPKLSFQAVE